MQLASQEAQRLNHENLGTEHILLGLVKEGSGVAANVLKDLGIDLRKVRLEVERMVPAGSRAVAPGWLPQDPPATRALEHAREEARTRDDHHVDPGHLLLGVLREEMGVGAQVLRKLGVDLKVLRGAILDARKSGSSLPSAQPRPVPPAHAFTAVPGGVRPATRQPGTEVDDHRPAQPGTPGAGAEASSLYERFSGQARRAVQLAHAEARRLREDHVGTGHLLLGALREESGSAAALLAACGIAPEKLKGGPFSPLPRADNGPDWETLPFTPRARAALEWARQEASRLGHPWVGPEHLLIAVTREQDSIAGEVLRDLALAFDSLREQLAARPPAENRDQLLQLSPTGPAAPPDPSAGALQTLVTANPLPPEVGEEEPAGGPRPPEEGRVQGPRQTPTEPDLPVVERQLMALRVCLAAVAGGLLCHVLLGPGGAVLGLFGGGFLGQLRHPHLTAALGCIAGLLGGHLYQPGEPWAYVAGGLSGLALGACMGDWRKLWAPPGSG
jgi:hypothetical protein